jgi:hypothetical protein
MESIFKKQMIELTFEKTGSFAKVGRLRIEFAEDPGRYDSPTRRYDAVLSVCNSPRCPCRSVQFSCTQTREDGVVTAREREHEFWLNFREKSALQTRELEKDSETSRLADIVVAELTPWDWLRIERWFPTAKFELLDEIDTSEIPLSNLPMVEKDMMIHYQEVFPSGPILTFDLNDEVWGVYEQYCIQPACPCHDTVLSFLKLTDGTGGEIPPTGVMPSIRYDYKSETFSQTAPAPNGSPPLDALLAFLQDECPSLNLQLEFRHATLQHIYGRKLLEQLKPRLQLLAGITEPDRVSKIGRNEPCLCGSGRKYKQCCLRNPKSLDAGS